MAEVGRSGGGRAADRRLGDTRDGFISVARTVLFLMDLVAVQQLLEGRRLITPEVEDILGTWIAEHEADLAELVVHMRSITDDAERIAARRDLVEAMLGELMQRLPSAHAAVGDPALPHAS